MAAPPPPPPPPSGGMRAPPAPKGKGGSSLASMLANNNLTTGDDGSTTSISGHNPAMDAPDHIKAPSSFDDPPKSNAKSSNSFMDELRGRLGSPVDYESSGTVEFNPSTSRPGYRPPANLPQGGTQGAEKVLYQIKGPQVGKVQAAVVYQLFCRTEDKQLIDIDMNILEAELTAEKNNEQSKGIITKAGKGEFKITFRGRYVGQYHWNIWVKGRMEKRPIYEPPGVPLELIATDPIIKQTTLFTISGYGMQGGKVGKTLFFEIVTRSEAGAQIDCDIDRIRVIVSQGQKRVLGEVSRVEMGKYRAAFSPFGPGQCIVAVEYGGQEVAKSMAEFHTGIDSRKTELLSPPSHVLIGQETRLIIQARDAEGNPLPTGGERFDVACSGPSQGVAGLVVRDELNGTYVVRFTCTKGGTFKFFISLSGVDIKNTPLIVDAK